MTPMSGRSAPQPPWAKLVAVAAVLAIVWILGHDRAVLVITVAPDRATRATAPGPPCSSAAACAAAIAAWAPWTASTWTSRPASRSRWSGPNGAGKTTLLTILAGVARPAAAAPSRGPTGSAPRVGWVPQRPALYPRLTARENLRLFAALEGADDADALADELIERADLGDVRRPAGRPSCRPGRSSGSTWRSPSPGGRASCCWTSPRPPSAPTSGTACGSWLDELRGGGMALLFSTQSVDEAMRRGDRMLVLAAGRLLFAGTAERDGAAPTASGRARTPRRPSWRSSGWSRPRRRRRA